MVCLHDTGGFGSEPAIPDVRRTVQVVVRAADPAQAKAKAWELFNALDRPENRVIRTGTRKLFVKALQPPTPQGDDEKGRFWLTFNLAINTARD